MILGLGLCLSLAACGGQGSTAEQSKTESQEGDSSAVTENVLQAVEEASEAVEAEADENAADTTESADSTSTLVVYFSNTGNTRAIAELIADGTSADLYEIIPEDPYTDADLDYGNDESRSTIEMNDSDVRPAIAGTAVNIEQYDTIYVGYPIWWGEAPRILDTFVESYDFTDKTVIPFCTSSSSGIGSSATTLESLAGTGDWVSGERFSGDESADEVMAWANQF